MNQDGTYCEAISWKRLTGGAATIHRNTDNSNSNSTRCLTSNHLTDKYIILLSSEIRVKKVSTSQDSTIRPDADHGQSIHWTGCRNTWPTQGAAEELSEMRALQIILVLSKTDDIPEFMPILFRWTKCLCLPNRQEQNIWISGIHSLPSFNGEKESDHWSALWWERRYHSSEVVNLGRVSIRYETDDFWKNWTGQWTVVNDGHSADRTVPEGTLLSLICADNQKHVCDIGCWE